MALTIIVLGALHALCCGLPLLLLSGVSLTAILPTSPISGVILAVLGLVGLGWHLQKGCAKRPGTAMQCGQGRDATPPRQFRDIAAARAGASSGRTSR